MTYEKKCQICGTVFETVVKSRNICLSTKCFKERNCIYSRKKLKSPEWRKAHNEYMRKRYHDTPGVAEAQREYQRSRRGDAEIAARKATYHKSKYKDQEYKAKLLSRQAEYRKNPKVAEAIRKRRREHYKNHNEKRQRNIKLQEANTKGRCDKAIKNAIRIAKKQDFEKEIPNESLAICELILFDLCVTKSVIAEIAARYKSEM